MVWSLLGTVKRYLEGMGFGIISGYGRGIGCMPEEDFTYGSHDSFFYYYFPFMDFQVAIAADIG